MSLHSKYMCIAIATAALAVAAGCSRAPAPDGTEQTGAAEPAAPPPPAAKTEFGETLLWIDPLKVCGDKQVTMVHWSKAAVAKGPASIELGDVNPGVFARIGDEGQKESGPWAYPGAVIVLRGADGEVRARQVIKGPDDCSAPSAADATAPAAAPAEPALEAAPAPAGSTGS